MTENAPQSIGRAMGIAAVILSVSVLLSRVLGFLREAVIAAQHGATAATDAYYAAFTLPDLMNYFLAGGTLSITFIPLFAAYITRNDEEGGWRLFSVVATTMGSLLVAATIFFMFAAPNLVPLLFPGFVGNPEKIELTVRMTRIVIPAQLCFYVGGLLNATLFVRKKFWPAAISPLIYNLCIIAGGLALEPWFGIEGFAIGVLIGALLGPLGVPLYAARKEVRFRPLFAPRDAGFREFLWLSLPLMLGVGLVTVDEWLLRYFGSYHGEGPLALLNNSRKLMLVVFGLIGQAAGQAALPFLTELYHKGERTEMAQMLAKSVGRVVFLAAVGAAALASAAPAIVHVVFRRGAYTMEDAASTATLLVCFCLGLVSWAAQTMAVRGFYARSDTFTPMVVATGVVALVLPIYIGLDAQWGLVGLALASSLGITVNAIATIAVYRWRTGELPLAPIWGGLWRGGVVAAVCGALSWGVYVAARDLLPLTSTATSLAMGVAQGTAFAIGLALLTAIWRPPELAFVVDRIAARLNRKRS